MDKREPGVRRLELNKELAAFWGEAADVGEQLLKLTTRGKEENWTMARYLEERAPLMAQKAALFEKIKPLMEERAALDAILGS